VYLKTLTLRGFKSFASTTRLAFEPGITCVVGPNGSGKSNVVDALAWVMGEQGAKSLRGGRMEDVIFAGTRTRPALGRAEVRLTIDNTDGALPIDYTEVTISRTLFRNGGSEYAINGTSCRLLDIQELLSDTGLGREMHVIVGQGHLDDVLTASPEERRGFIEEAAGVLKHRKRKERALRKLDNMQANLTRLQDLTAEIRRQLGPLAKQADVARRAQTIQIAVRDAGARLLADDAAQLEASLAAEAADETALNEHREHLQATLAGARQRLMELEQHAAAAVPELSKASELYFRLAALAEKVRGTRNLAAERARLLGQGEFHLPAAGVTGAGSTEGLEALAAKLSAEQGALETQLSDADAAVESARRLSQLADQAFREEDERYAAALRAVADRRESLATLTGRVATARSRVEGRMTEIAHLTDQLEAALAARAEAEQEFTVLEQQIAGVEDGEAALNRDHEKATAELDRAKAGLAELGERQSAARAQLAGASAARDALELAMAAKDASAALTERVRTLGPLAGLLQVEKGWEAAIAAGLGPAAEALAVAAIGDAVDSLRLARAEDLGLTAIVIGRDLDANQTVVGEGAAPDRADGSGSGPLERSDRADDAPDVSRPGASLATGTAGGISDPAAGGPPEGRWALTAVQAGDHGIAGALAELLAGVVLTDNLAEAQRVVAANPALTAVTKDGDLLSASFAAGGSAGGQSPIELAAAHAEAGQTMATAQAALEATAFELKGASARLAEAEQAVAATMEALTQSDAKHAAVADRLGHLAAAAGSSRDLATKVQARLDEAQAALAEDQSALEAASAELEAAQNGDGTYFLGPDDRRAAGNGHGRIPGAEDRQPARADDALDPATSGIAAGNGDGTYSSGVDAAESAGRTPPAVLARSHAAGDGAHGEGRGEGGDGIGQLGGEPNPAERDRLSAEAQNARQALTEATLEARALRQRLEGLATRIAATRRAAETERQAEEKAKARAERRAEQAAVALAVERAAAQLEGQVGHAAQAARDQRDLLEQRRAERETELAGLRGAIDQVRAELAEITSEVHRDEMARAAGAAKLEGVAARALEEFGLTLDTLREEYGPDQPIPDPAAPEAEPIPYVREEQEKRLRRAQRELTALGRVNPLALEEYAALEERHEFLSRGLDDIKRSRADLLKVVREIDARVEEVFASAFVDTQEAFTRVFGRLFPGGEGRLVATDPTDWLATGVDIEARPAGKAVKRLSLLSGGERSLVAVAFTLAIFMARPSPFYVMDEVEAALDETNLGRLLGIVEELRTDSQVLMVTHQKRSMEIADALYGVTMRDDGVSTVISQRLREPDSR
jgi:chromosome segregation protein